MSSLGITLTNLVAAQHNHGVRQQPREENGGIMDTICRVSPLVLGLIAAIGASVILGPPLGVLIGAGAALATFLIGKVALYLRDRCQGDQLAPPLGLAADLGGRQFQPNMAPGRGGHVPQPACVPVYQPAPAPRGAPHVLPGGGHFPPVQGAPVPMHQPGPAPRGAPHVLPGGGHFPPVQGAPVPVHQPGPAPRGAPQVQVGGGHFQQAPVAPVHGHQHMPQPNPPRGGQAPGGNVRVGRGHH